MNLWIRTQDKTTLIRSYEIYIAEYSDSYVIRAKRTSHILGVYKKFERALEILDELEKCLSKGIFATVQNGLGETKNFIPVPSCVYKMPKE